MLPKAPFSITSASPAEFVASPECRVSAVPWNRRFLRFAVPFRPIPLVDSIRAVIADRRLLKA
jgi:hypothetical protein